MIKPLISIFVPTKNRYQFLKNLITLIESYKDERVELVIQDNTEDNSAIMEYMSCNDYHYTRYYHYSEFLTMSQNSDLAFSHCRGEYVCMIGDDDAVCRNIGDCAQWMLDNDIDALRSLEAQFIYEETKTLLYYGDIKPYYKYYNPLKELKKSLRRGLPDFGNIPKPYHGIVRRSLMEKLRSVGGTCFPGCTPDMSGAVSSCFFVKKFVIVDIPVILSGLSNMNSGGLSGQILTLDEVPWIEQKTRDNWESKIPRIWAREFIWPESGSKGLRYLGHEEYLKELDYDMMKCRYLVMHKQHHKEVIDSAPSKLKLYFAMLKVYMTVGVRYVVTRKLMKPFNHKMNGVYNYENNLSNIIQAEEYFFKKSYYLNFNELKKK